MPTYKVEYEEKAVIKYVAIVEADSEEEAMDAVSDEGKVTLKTLTEWKSIEISPESTELLEED